MSVKVVTRLSHGNLRQARNAPRQKDKRASGDGVVILGLSKQGERFFNAIATSRDATNTSRLINKFVTSSPKSVAIDALSHLLSPNFTHPRLSSLALPLYLKITEAPWFAWNPKLVARLVALLDKQGRESESKTLISETLLKLESREREIVHFYCSLIESQSRTKSIQGFSSCYVSLYQLVSGSKSVYVKKQGYKCMISGLCEMDRAEEAESLIGEMRRGGLKPSMFEFRCLIYGYGRLGLFEDMQRIINKMEHHGIKVDTVCSNMVLSSYGSHNALRAMVLWLQKMKILQIPLSIRTCNSVLNSCPTIISLVHDSKFDTYPISISELMPVVSEDEALLVKEITGSLVLNEVMLWNDGEMQLDLHGMHLATAYVMLLHWMDEIRDSFSAGKNVPAEVTVICGLGNHSSVRGESPIKRMVKEIMVRTKSSLRINRKNNGCFIAKGKTIQEWLC